MTLHTLHHRALALTVVALAGCGGGGGDGGGDPASPLSFSGTVATGAALADASVQIKCATGSANTRTDTEGAYAAAIPGGGLPCLLRATGSDGGMVLHSLVENPGPGTKPIVANITPVTEMVLARLLADADTAGAFDAFAPATREKLGTGGVKSAVEAIQSALAPIDPLFATMDPLRGGFTAESSKGSGDATDKAIDTLVAQANAAAPDLTTSRARLQALAKVLAQAPASGTATAAKAYLAPPVAGCPALRNVPYRFVGTYGDVFKGANLDWAAGKLDLTAPNSASDAATVAFDGLPPCQFLASAPGLVVDGYAAKSGVLVLRDQGTSDRLPGMGLGFPEQRLAVADLAGTWNVLGFGYRSGYAGFRNTQGVVTLDAQGKITSSLDCRGTHASSDTCTSSLEPDAANTFIANADGGFLGVDGHGNVMPGNIYAFRDAAGNMMMVLTNANGGLAIATPQARLPLPNAGVTTNYWNIGLGQLPGMARLNTSVTSSRYTFQSVDTAAGTVTRQRILFNGAANGRMDIKQYNQPRHGLQFTDGSSYTLNGSPLTLTDSVLMPIPGMGLSVDVHPGDAMVANTSMYLNVSIVRPAD